MLGGGGGGSNLSKVMGESLALIFSIRPDLPGTLQHKDTQRPGCAAHFGEERSCAQFWCRLDQSWRLF